MNRYYGLRGALERAGFVKSSAATWATGFAIGAGFGLVAGAAVALLVAPTTGGEVRREIGSRAKKFAERTQGAISDARAQVKGKFAHGLERVEDETHRGRKELASS